MAIICRIFGHNSKPTDKETLKKTGNKYVCVRCFKMRKSIYHKWSHEWMAAENGDE